MQEFVLSLPGTVTLGSEGGGVGPLARERPSGKVYRLPVPDRLKGHSVPEDIGSFINDLYPHMRLSLLRKFVPADEVDDYISDYVAYQLDTDKNGVKRYTTYDPVKYPNMPYYKWFLSVLKYRKMYYAGKLTPNNKFVDIFSMETEGRSVGLAREFSLGGEFLDGLFAHLPDYAGRISIAEVAEAVRLYSRSHANWERHSFRRNAWRFLVCKYMGYKNVEIAGIFNVSVSAVTQWGNMLAGLVARKFPGFGHSAA
jgi:hypothetical protein